MDNEDEEFLWGSVNDNTEDCSEDLQELGLEGPVKCLFCEEIFNSAVDVFSHCTEQHHFDVSTFCPAWSVDSIGYIKFINYVRSKVK